MAQLNRHEYRGRRVSCKDERTERGDDGNTQADFVATDYCRPFFTYANNCVCVLEFGRR